METKGKTEPGARPGFMPQAKARRAGGAGRWRVTGNSRGDAGCRRRSDAHDRPRCHRRDSSRRHRRQQRRGVDRRGPGDCPPGRRDCESRLRDPPLLPHDSPLPLRDWPSHRRDCPRLPLLPGSSRQSCLRPARPLRRLRVTARAATVAIAPATTADTRRLPALRRTTVPRADRRVQSRSRVTPRVAT